MIKTQVVNGNIEKALTFFKKKCLRVGFIKELRERQYYDKPSVKKRFSKEKAIYVEKKFKTEN